MKKIFTLAVLAILGVGSASADVTDELTVNTFDVSGTSYVEKTDIKATSSAVYYAQMAGGNSSIQLRSSNSNSGIVTTASGGTIKSVKIEWNSNTNNARILDVYGNTTAYTDAKDLYDNDKQGTKIASFLKSEGDQTITIEGSYQFIGFRSNSGAMYIDKITIVWEGGDDIVIAPAFSLASGMYFETQSVELSTETEGASIYYTTNGDVPTASSTPYTTAISIAETATLKAIAVKGDKTSNPSTATYTIFTGLTGNGTIENPLTVADARTIIATLEDKGTTPTMYVQGYVVGEVSIASNQATFTIGASADATEDLITVYKAKSLENSNYQDGDVKAGDLVIICAPLQKYGETYETQYGYIYSINGVTGRNIEYVGNGTEENPYTVGDLRQMPSKDYPTEAVWVKGYIIGSASSATALNAADKAVASNIAIAATADATEFTPVELKANTEFRSKLNVADNTTNIGKEVKLKGTITSYFSTTGVKDLVDAIIDGESVVTSISSVKAAAEFKGAIYNIAGQKVSASYKGLVIKNGKKIVQK